MNYSYLTDQISKLTITGVTCLDIDEIPETVILRGGTALLFPDPANVITDMVVKRETFMTGANVLYSYRYNLNYILACFQVGEGRGLRDLIPQMAVMGAAVMEALSETHYTSPVLNPVIPTIRGFTTFNDPAGAPLFHGATIALAVHEFGGSYTSS